MNYETPQLFQIGIADEVIQGSIGGNCDAGQPHLCSDATIDLDD
jgi:hypothetical protein